MLSGRLLSGDMAGPLFQDTLEVPQEAVQGCSPAQQPHWVRLQPFARCSARCPSCVADDVCLARSGQGAKLTKLDAADVSMPVRSQWYYARKITIKKAL